MINILCSIFNLISELYHFLAQEIVSLKKVDHPNIIKIHEIYREEEKLYIVMERVKGKDLLDYLFSIEILTETQAAIIIKQILKALNHMNSLNLWHRDIKLENIMINPDTMQVKLIDFGFSSFYRFIIFKLSLNIIKNILIDHKNLKANIN